MNPVRPVDSRGRFVKFANRVVLLSVTAGFLAFAFLIWHLHIAQASIPPGASRGIESGSMSGVGVENIIGGLVSLLILAGYDRQLGVLVSVLMIASAISVIFTTIALISEGPRQSKLAWV